ncbi:hypothetical protein fugu_015458 [Takifugu bimaculatus]|uniref:Immunoglobulin V-set domain-containing protein n=1 Tax=Takifugu bimaculatus TaxID=433685 RepID=A0A4Z2BZA4_9TELE|nr:hypothetical protein fugu_015458 [Takifugu bimaculatus]
MRTTLTSLLVSIQLFEACAELIFRQLAEGQALQLSCPLGEQQGPPTGLHLYHRGGQTQTTLLSMAEGAEPKVNPQHRGRLQLHGGLRSPQVNVSVSDLQRGDTGLYVWELSSRENSSEEVSVSAAKVLLLVEGRWCPCSPSYPPLLLTLFVAAGLLLLALCCLALDNRLKVRKYHRPQPPVAIYEEMTSKKQQQQAGEIPPNHPEAPRHLEEVNFPVYANPNIRPPQDNHYACPRRLASNAHGK